MNKILIIDDEIDITESISAILSDEGFNCTKALNPSDAIKLFENNVFDKAFLVYNSFKNAAVQITVNEPFLPVVPVEFEKESSVDYIFEPDQEEILKELIPS